MSLFAEIKKDFGGFILDIRLETHSDRTGLLGASGSGKSVAMMCVAGVITPDSGKIVLNDRVLFDSKKKINLTPQKRRVGYLFQNYALFPNMNVKQNIMCALRGEKDIAKKEDTFKEIIKITELSGLETRFLHQLSGGQRQRVALARILAGNPELLILDEPFSSVDAYLREQLQTETRKLLKSFGNETVFVTHSRDEIYYMCKEIALIDSGKVISQKETKQLFCDPGSVRAAVLTGCKNIAAAKKTGTHKVMVTDWGIELTTAEPVRDNLCAVGIRARYFDADETQNGFPVRLTDETEKPFEHSLQFRFVNQSDETKDVCYLVPKGRRTAHTPKTIGVNPENVMLLYA